MARLGTTENLGLDFSWLATTVKENAPALIKASVEKRIAKKQMQAASYAAQAGAPAAPAPSATATAAEPEAVRPRFDFEQLKTPALIGGGLLVAALLARTLGGNRGGAR